MKRKRYKKIDDVKIDDFGKIVTKTIVEKMTEKEHRKLFKEHALEHCSSLASASCADIKLALRDFIKGDITFEQAMKLVAIAKEDFLNSVEEQKIEEYISHFDVENIWKNHIDDVRKMYDGGTKQ